MLKSNVLRSTFDPRQDKVKRRWKQLGLHKAALHKLCSQPTIMAITSRRMRCIEHAISAAK